MEFYMLFYVFYVFLSIFGVQNYVHCSVNLFKSSDVLEKAGVLHDIQIEQGIGMLQNTAKLFNDLWKFIILYRKKLEDKSFGFSWKGYSHKRKISEILEDWKRAQKGEGEIIFDVPRNASYQRCMRAYFLENLSKKVNEKPAPDFNELNYIMNISYEHSMWFWTSKLIEKNYNTYHITEKAPDEIQDIFKEIKKFYEEEISGHINLFFAPIDLNSVNVTQLKNRSQHIIPKALTQNIRRLYELITDFVNVRSGEFSNKDRRTHYDDIIDLSIIKHFYPQKYEDIKKRMRHVKNLVETIDFLNYQNENNRWNF